MNLNDPKELASLLEAWQVAEAGSPAELGAREDGVFRRMQQLQAEGANWSL